MRVVQHRSTSCTLPVLFTAGICVSSWRVRHRCAPSQRTRSLSRTTAQCRQTPVLNISQGTFSRNVPSLSDFRLSWYAAQLRAMHEPSLLDLAKDKSVLAYRFVWLRTFHHPIAVSKSAATRWDRPTSLGRDDRRRGLQSRSDTQIRKPVKCATTRSMRFQALLHAIDYWSMPTQDSDECDSTALVDFRRSRDGQYHVVTRWSPRNRSLPCKLLVFTKLSKIKVEPEEIY